MGLLYAIDHGSIEIIQGMSSDQPSVLTRVIFVFHFSVDFHRDFDQNRHFLGHFRRFHTDFCRFWAYNDHVFLGLWGPGFWWGVRIPENRLWIRRVQTKDYICSMGHFLTPGRPQKVVSPEGRFSSLFSRFLSLFGHFWLLLDWFWSLWSLIVFVMIQVYLYVSSMIL